MPAWVVIAVAGVGLAHLVARYAGAPWLAGLLKPLPILLLALVVARGEGPAGAAYRHLVVLGLVCSMTGDVLLVFPAAFVAGLASFLAAHLAYVAAFSGRTGWAAACGPLLVPFALVAAIFLHLLRPHLGRMRPAVVAYTAVIALMGWRAAAAAAAVPGPATALGLVGAVLFMLSDGVLATDRFARPFRAAAAVVMITYYAAQTLIAASALV